MASLKNVSKYAQRMRRLSCKIFGEYYKPPMPQDVRHDPVYHVRAQWEADHYQNMSSIARLERIPFDLDDARNHMYYPPHPQHRRLMWTLREHGLYRNEHQDFVEEMKRMSILRGAKPRVKGGMSGKRSILKK